MKKILLILGAFALLLQSQCAQEHKFPKGDGGPNFIGVIQCGVDSDPKKLAATMISKKRHLDQMYQVHVHVNADTDIGLIIKFMRELREAGLKNPFKVICAVDEGSTASLENFIDYLPESPLNQSILKKVK